MEGERERKRRQTLSWRKINCRIGQVSTCLPPVTTLINNICQNCQLTLMEEWRFRNQSCVSSVKMNSLSWIWKMPASHSFAYCCPMNIFIQSRSEGVVCALFTDSLCYSVMININQWKLFGHRWLQAMQLLVSTQYIPMLFTLYPKRLRWQFHWHRQKWVHGCKWISAGKSAVGRWTGPETHHNLLLFYP